MKRTIKPQSDRRGILLLVVLSALTFFSLLIAAYMVFSNESQQTAFRMSNRTTRAPDIEWITNEALMTLIRGTSDVNNPFYGEDLLSDYWGTKDNIVVQSPRLAGGQFNVRAPIMIGNGFVRIPIVKEADGLRVHDLPRERVDDVLAGRVITFDEGPLRNRSYRVIRSIYQPPSASQPEYDDVYIELSPSDISATANRQSLLAQCYADTNNDGTVDATDTATGAYNILMNGAPRNSRGIGFETDNIDANVDSRPEFQMGLNPNLPIGGSNRAIGLGNLAIELQPNHSGSQINKSLYNGDFDESYDAADYNNWFLAHSTVVRDTSANPIEYKRVTIPSFHRPSVLNFILNERTEWTTARQNDFTDVIASFSRGTFRPLPIAGTTFAGINERFTGGNSNYALRVPISVNNDNEIPGRLDQIARALIDGPWDVDNDSDGQPDSIWVDLGLPYMTAPDGRLIKPLIAPMIEDLGGRLNVNAHQSTAVTPDQVALRSTAARYAGTTGALGTDTRLAFRGVGFGPADISILPKNDVGTDLSATELNELASIVADRYRAVGDSIGYIAGRAVRDTLDGIRNGYRPPLHLVAGAIGYSEDPFGRSGYGIGRSGNLITSNVGTIVSQDNPATAEVEPLVNEAMNDPYESDPSGRLSGDSLFTLSDLEAVLRINEFGGELLSQELRSKIQSMLNNNPVFARALTTTSRSDDTPANFDAEETAMLSLVKMMNRLSGSAPLTNAQISRLIAPELRLGRKLDVNRPFGNRIDDNANGIIDEPAETRAVNLNGTPSEPNAFLIRNGGGGVIPTDFQNRLPNYLFDERQRFEDQFGPGSWTGGMNPTVEPQVDGRQLLARHLYVLMMTLATRIDQPNNGFEFMTISMSGRPPEYTPERHRARRLAQWAVNVVDYRDPDSIMTRFAYDPDPFTDGWNVTDTRATPASQRNVVWGVERPELILTESMAFHDVGLADIRLDGGEGETKTATMNADDDSDSVRMPQGSLFLELLNPRPVINGDQNTKPAIDAAMHLLQGTQFELNLAAEAPPVSGNRGAPVWRIAITQPHYDNTAVPTAPSGNEAVDPANLRETLPESFSFEMRYRNELADNATNAANRLQYDRFITFVDFPDADSNPAAALNAIGTWLSDNNLDTEMRREQVFFAPSLSRNWINDDRTLAPGQYVTLAPRVNTRLGSKRDGANIPGLPSDQQFTVSENEGLILFDRNDRRITPTLSATAAYTQALDMVIATVRPTSWNVPSDGPNFQDNVVGLNVSEPLPNDTGYYPRPDYRYNGTADANYPLTDAYIDYDDPATVARDTPVDITRPTPRIPFDPAAPAPEPYLGTVPQYCSVLLQRLADPTSPYDELLNPYRTVDYMPVDLTVFSGEAAPTDINPTVGQYTRRSRQKNGAIKNIDGTLVSPNPGALFSYETNDVENAALDTTGADDYFTFEPTTGAMIDDEGHPFCSFSFLNTSLTLTDGTGNQVPVNPLFAGFPNSIGSRGAAAVNVVGHERNFPQIAFAMHPWLNRPFATPLELMMVPACSAGRLFEEFTLPPSGMDPTVYLDEGDPEDPSIFYGPFRHLLNFFHNGELNGEAAEFHRLFDLVHTMPRYMGEVEYISPVRLQGANTTETTQLRALRALMSPPFNLRYSNQREATINLNSIGEFPVWAGLMAGHVTVSEIGSFEGDPGDAQSQLAYESFLDNRRGYKLNFTQKRVTASGGDFRYGLGLHPQYPTQFAGVFKRQFDGPYAPSMDGRAKTDLLRVRETHTGLLRGTDKNNDTSSIDRLDVLETNAAGLSPLFVRDVSEDQSGHLDRRRNAFTRYQTLMRMPNLVSENSQVFLIRMTVGFFEVDPSNTSSVGAEYQADVGQNKRHKAMFVVDRSIPVGFEPGVDRNTRDVVIFESRD